jgi:hypothetical protein
VTFEIPMVPPQEENEWQPVRIAPVNCPYERQLNDREQARYDAAKLKIVRVKPVTVTSRKVLCPGRHFELHPTDAEMIYGYSVMPNVIACEHQILAD